MKVWLLLLLLAACTPIPLEENTPSRPIFTTDVGVPDIPRSNISEESYEGVVEKPQERPIFIVNLTPASDLDVPLGDTIGKHHPIITRREFPLLAHSPIRVNQNLLLGYEQLLKFDFGANTSGRIVFTFDERTDEIGSFLKFEEGKPIFQYILRLNQGTFYDISGRDIQVLGHTYTIAEATNNSVTLYGKTVSSNLIFTNGERLFVNNSRRGSTLVNVTPNTLSFTLFAQGKDDDNIILSPGESITENVGQLKLGSDLFDIRYKGAPFQDMTQVKIKNSNRGFKLVAEVASGPLNIDLAEIQNGKVVLGGQERLHVRSCGFCIAPDDNIVLTTPNKESFILRYSGTSVDPNIVRFYDAQGNQYNYRFTGKPGSAAVDVVVGNTPFHVRIGPRDNKTDSYNLSVDFRSSDIILLDESILRLGTPVNNTVPIDIIVKRTGVQEQATRLKLVFNTTNYIDGGNLTFIEDEDTGDSVGMNSYGVTIVLNRERSMLLNRGEDALILIPRTRSYGIVSLEES